MTREFSRNYTTQQSYSLTSSQGEVIKESVTMSTYDSIHDEGFSKSQVVGDPYGGYKETRHYDDGTERVIERFPDGRRRGESLFTKKKF